MAQEHPKECGKDLKTLIWRPMQWSQWDQCRDQFKPWRPYRTQLWPIKPWTKGTSWVSCGVWHQGWWFFESWWLWGCLCLQGLPPTRGFLLALVVNRTILCNKMISSLQPLVLWMLWFISVKRSVDSKLSDQFGGCILWCCLKVSLLFYQFFWYKKGLQVMSNSVQSSSFLNITISCLNKKKRLLSY